jgi:hypothetical protein
MMLQQRTLWRMNQRECEHARETRRDGGIRCDPSMAWGGWPHKRAFGTRLGSCSSSGLLRYREFVACQS